MMKNRYCILGLYLILSALYCIVFCLIFTDRYGFDFLTLYSASKALAEGHNPYHILTLGDALTFRKLPVNLNPPITLWLVKPLLYLGYTNALLLWYSLSFIAGLIGAHLIFMQAFSADFFKKNKHYLYLSYLVFFPTVMNTAIGQLGSFLLFFTSSGYYFYVKKQDNIAGLLWGLIISIKLFPGLLFFYTLKQKRYKTLLVMLMTVLFLSVIPWLLYGYPIYNHYYTMISRVLWFGDSWNGSIQGFIFRLFVDTGDKNQSLLFVKTLYGLLFFLFLFVYIKKMGNERCFSKILDHPIQNGVPTKEMNKNALHRDNHQPFCLTLVMMLLLSPFGWLYYYSILIFPLALIWGKLVDDEGKNYYLMIAWLLSLFFINYPMRYQAVADMPSLAEQVSFFSFYFYGLMLLGYILIHKNELYVNFVEKKPCRTLVVLPLLSLIFGLIVCFIGLGCTLGSSPWRLIHDWRDFDHVAMQSLVSMSAIG